MVCMNMSNVHRDHRLSGTGQSKVGGQDRAGQHVRVMRGGAGLGGAGRGCDWAPGDRRGRDRNGHTIGRRETVGVVSPNTMLQLHSHRTPFIICMQKCYP